MTQPPPPPPGPPAGWFPDPSNPSRQRYFDGRTWTEHYANVGAPPPPGVASQPAKTGFPTGLKVLLALGAIVGLLGLAGKSCGSHEKSVSSGSSSRTASAASAPSASAVRDVPAPAGSSVRDGKFEFRVLGVERSATKAGAFNTEQAKGEFFIVNLEVTNVGDDARSFSASSQHLIVNGNKYDATSSITDKNWMEDINPGLGIQASVTFDIPKGSTPTAIECHDSMFSGGALLAL